MNDELKMIGGGLKPTPKDERDYVFGNIHPPVNLREIAEIDFDVYEFDEVLDQESNDKCTGYGMAKILEAHEGVKISPDYLFAKGKQVSGENPDEWGLDLRSIFRAAVKFGGLERNHVSERLKHVRDGTKWSEECPACDEFAANHKQQSFFFIEQDGYPDLFDALRAALWQYKDKKSVIGTGAMWRQNWIYQKWIEKVEEDGFGHFFALIGVKHFDGKPYLKVLNSGGPDIGDGGYHYFSREVVNSEFTYGAGIVVDMSKELAKALNASRIREDSWRALLVRIRIAIKNYFGEILR